MCSDMSLIYPTSNLLFTERVSFIITWYFTRYYIISQSNVSVLNKISVYYLIDGVSLHPNVIFHLVIYIFKRIFDLVLAESEDMFHQTIRRLLKQKIKRSECHAASPQILHQKYTCADDHFDEVKKSPKRIFFFGINKILVLTFVF